LLAALAGRLFHHAPQQNANPLGNTISSSMESEPPEIWQSRQLLSMIESPADSVDRGNPPEPDVVVRQSGRLVGIEVTEVKPSDEAMRRFEGEAEGILRNAGSRNDLLGNPPALVSVFWMPDAKLPKNRRQSLVDEIVKTVASLMPEAVREKRVVRSYDQPVSTLPAEIEEVSIFRLPHTPSHFSGPRAALVPALTPSDLREAIGRKDLKVRNYRQSYDELWLLLLVAADGPSTWKDLEQDFPDLVYESHFNRVFVQSRMPPSVRELRVEVRPRVA
jgi:hypothetical protein